jgi:DNA invertase Pin-like site-specific DNA recombinase
MNWYKKAKLRWNQMEFSPEQLSRMRDLLLSGASRSSVAAEFNIGRDVLNRLIRENNWVYKSIKGQADLSTEDIQKIKDMVLQNIPYKKIGEQFGFGPMVIHNLNKKYKWRPIGDPKNLGYANIGRSPANKKEFSEEEMEVIKSLIEEGYSYKNIGSLFNVVKSVIARIAQENGWREKFVPQDLSSYEQQVIDLFNQGMGMISISKALGREITPDQAYRILRKHKLIGEEPIPVEEIGQKIRQNRWEPYGGLEGWMDYKGYGPEKRQQIYDAMHARNLQRKMEGKV